jgi:hypothetical protein
MRISPVLHKVRETLASSNKKLPLLCIICEAHELHTSYITKGSIIDEITRLLIFYACIQKISFSCTFWPFMLHGFYFLRLHSGQYPNISSLWPFISNPVVFSSDFSYSSTGQLSIAMTFLQLIQIK